MQRLSVQRVPQHNSEEQIKGEVSDRNKHNAASPFCCCFCFPFLQIMLPQAGESSICTDFLGSCCPKVWRQNWRSKWLIAGSIHDLTSANSIGLMALLACGRALISWAKRWDASLGRSSMGFVALSDLGVTSFMYQSLTP